MEEGRRAGGGGGRGDGGCAVSRGRLSEEARFELAMGASARERRNRPVALVALAGAVLVAAGVFAGWSLSMRGSAIAERARAIRDERAVEALAGEWEELARRQREAPDVRLGDPMPNILSRMEELATGAGLKTRPTNPQTRVADRRQGVVVNEYIYRTVKDPSLRALMEWVRSAAAEPGMGMEVTDLKLRPEQSGGWTMDVTFRRWERSEQPT